MFVFSFLVVKLRNKLTNLVVWKLGSIIDVVLCSETIEHVTAYKAPIEELLRITKNVLIITVPHKSPEEVAQNIKNKVPHRHINYFDIDSLDYLKARG